MLAILVHASRTGGGEIAVGGVVRQVQDILSQPPAHRPVGQRPGGAASRALGHFVLTWACREIPRTSVESRPVRHQCKAMATGRGC